jgi:hypothetical protein
MPGTGLVAGSQVNCVLGDIVKWCSHTRDIAVCVAKSENA